MKRTLISVLSLTTFIVIISAGCGRNTSGKADNIARDTTGVAFLKFDELEHDFGVIKPGEKVGYIFSFTNTGDADLVISSATTSCGCTIPKYDKKPVPPGKRGSLEVAFDSSGRYGKQSKTIVVLSDAENKLVILRIMAEIKTE